MLVSNLTAAGADPAAVRLAVLAHHYRGDWEWTDALLEEAHARLERWRAAAARAEDAGEPGVALVQSLRAAIGDDLDTPTAIARVDEWAASDAPAAEVVAAVDALLGVALR